MAAGDLERSGPGISSHEFIVEFDAATVTLDAVQRAAYSFTDRVVIDIRTGTNVVICELRSRSEDLEREVMDEFRLAVLDHVLRERIREETDEVRNLILALAFSRTGLTD